MRVCAFGGARTLAARTLAALAVAGLLLACSGADPSRSANRNAGAADVPQEVAVDRYFADIESFWARTLPAVFGVDLDPVDRVVPYRSSDPTTLPACNGVIGEPLWYAQNAFFCRTENIIVYDAEGLVEPLRENYGTFSIGVLLAHEYAHAIQAQTGEQGTPLGIELQADCFAGAWAAAFRAKDALAVAPSDLDAVRGSYLEFADPGAAEIGDPDAHGTAADRISAFSEGFDDGAASCAAGGTAQSQSPRSNFAPG